MRDEAQLAAEMRDLLNRIDVPSTPLASIAMRQKPIIRRKTSRLVPIVTAACIALIIVANPAASRSVMESVTQKIASMLQWTPPPAAPRRLISGMHAHSVTLSQARAAVPFTLTPPAGLPSDTVRSSIVVIPTATHAERAWSKGANAIVFSYRRRDGRTVRFMASAYSNDDVPSKYMFVEVGTRANGEPIVKRHEQFAWRNGTQALRVTDEGIDAVEIAAVRRAMRGTPIAAEWPPKRRAHEKMYILQP